MTLFCSNLRCFYSTVNQKRFFWSSRSGNLTSGQLSDAIGKKWSIMSAEYPDIISDDYSSLTTNRVLEIQRMIKEERYTLSPFQVFIFNSREEYLNYNCGSLHIPLIVLTLKEDNIKSYIRLNPSQEDSLVLFSLGCLINNLIIDKKVLTPTSVGLRMGLKDYYSNISSLTPVSRLYRLDLTKFSLSLKKSSYKRELL